MKVLVTGANGLLGNHLTRALLKEGHQVRVMVRRQSNLSALEGLDVDYAYGDVRDAQALREAARGCQVLYHTAAVFSYWGHSREEMMETAREGARNAVDAAAQAGVDRLVLTSSAAVLGARRQPVALAEYDDSPLERAPDYFASKVLQEQSALERGQELGLDVIAVNPSVFLGPRDMRPSAGLDTISGYLADPLHMTWPGGVNIAHVEDVAQAHIFLTSQGRPGERHIVCGENWEWRAIHEALSQMAGVRGPGLTMSPALARAGGALMEWGSRLTGRPPMATQDQAQVVGCYFWYNGQKLEDMGFTTRPTREALLDAVAWWLDSPHITPALRRRMRPTDQLQSRRGLWG
jgi:dihydroflavonol-4-reductase